VRRHRQQQLVDDAEHRGVRADPQRERQHGGDREGGAVPETAGRVAHVLRDPVPPVAAAGARGAAVVDPGKGVPMTRDVAKAALRLSTRGVRRHAAVGEL
jgi:hypothetical protein